MHNHYQTLLQEGTVTVPSEELGPLLGQLLRDGYVIHFDGDLDGPVKYDVFVAYHPTSGWHVILD